MCMIQHGGGGGALGPSVAQWIRLLCTDLAVVSTIPALAESDLNRDRGFPQLSVNVEWVNDTQEK